MVGAVGKPGNATSSVGVRWGFVGASSGEGASAGGSSSQAGEVGDATAMEAATWGASIMTASLSKLTTDGAGSSCGSDGVDSMIVVGADVVAGWGGTSAGGHADMGRVPSGPPWLAGIRVPRDPAPGVCTDEGANAVESVVGTGGSVPAGAAVGPSLVIVLGGGANQAAVPAVAVGASGASNTEGSGCPAADGSASCMTSAGARRLLFAVSLVPAKFCAQGRVLACEMMPVANLGCQSMQSRNQVRRVTGAFCIDKQLCLLPLTRSLYLKLLAVQPRSRVVQRPGPAGTAWTHGRPQALQCDNINSCAR